MRPEPVRRRALRYIMMFSFYPTPHGRLLFNYRTVRRVRDYYYYYALNLHHIIFSLVFDAYSVRVVCDLRACVYTRTLRTLCEISLDDARTSGGRSPDRVYAHAYTYMTYHGTSPVRSLNQRPVALSVSSLLRRSSYDRFGAILISRERKPFGHSKRPGSCYTRRAFGRDSFESSPSSKDHTSAESRYGNYVVFDPGPFKLAL